MANASIEKSLYVGILKSRFDLFDDVRIKTKHGDVIEGTIIEFEGDNTVVVSTNETNCDIRVDDIVECEDSWKADIEKKRELYRIDHNLPKIKNYGLAKQHHTKSKEIYDFISEVDFANGDVFCLKKGGDGDNGEMLMDLLDAYFNKTSGFHPICETYKEREDCFVSNGESYPLCKGNGEEKCHDCCQYEDYEQYHSPY